jgi:hypothetical protein
MQMPELQDLVGILRELFRFNEPMSVQKRFGTSFETAPECERSAFAWRPEGLMRAGRCDLRFVNDDAKPKQDING